MENRAEAIFLSEVTEASSDDRNAELEKLEKNVFKFVCLCLKQRQEVKDWMN